MQSFIYKSLKKEGLYLYVDRKDDFSNLPEDLLSRLGGLVFVMELEITASRRLAREDAGKVLNSLQNTGFFIQLPPRIDEPSLVLKHIS